jgi:hypothetical protein
MGGVERSGLLGALAEYLLQNRWAACCAASTALFVEVVAVAACPFKHVRRFCGVLLIAFHLGVWAMLSIEFPLNIFYVLMFFVGIDELLVWPKREVGRTCSVNEVSAQKKLVAIT